MLCSPQRAADRQLPSCLTGICDGINAQIWASGDFELLGGCGNPTSGRGCSLANVGRRVLAPLMDKTFLNRRQSDEIATPHRRHDTENGAGNDIEHDHGDDHGGTPFEL